MVKLKYTPKFLEKVLEKHGYRAFIMTPQWSLFAIQILILEKLSEKK